VLRPINWQSPAVILEKIIQYEAVHEITSWDDLRGRLQPEDRRCFAFFHPAMPDEPLIFVEVALSKGIPNSIPSKLTQLSFIQFQTAKPVWQEFPLGTLSSSRWSTIYHANYQI
jgi:hypothetical protein